MASYQMTSTPVQRTPEDCNASTSETHSVQFLGCSPIVGQDTTKGLSRHRLSQVRLQQYEASPVRRVRSSVGTQRRVQLLSTCDKCTSKRRLVPAKEQTRRGTKKPMMGMTVISKDAAPVSSVASSTVPARQPVMGISATRKLKTISKAVNTPVVENSDKYSTPTFSSDLEDSDEGYCSRSLTGSLRSSSSQDQPLSVSFNEQSSTEVIALDLPEDEGIFIRRSYPVPVSECPSVCLFPPTAKRSRVTRRSCSMRARKVSSVALFGSKKELNIEEQQKSNVKSAAYQKLAKLRQLIRPKKTEVQMFCPH